MMPTTTRLNSLFSDKKNNLLSVYFTAGFPQLTDTLPILEALQAAGADIVEIGMPYSDPVADGETIQQSNGKALDNGMSVALLFEQLATMRQSITLPVLLMGYINPVLQYGVEKFCAQCKAVGVDGLILPDLPLQVYEEEYKAIFEKYGLCNVFLITPQTSEERIRLIDQLSDSFVYMVSSASVTGTKSGISHEQEHYFERIAAMQLRNPRLIGFGISNHETFTTASRHANGAIIGSAFIKLLQQHGASAEAIKIFVKEIKGL